MPAPGPGGGRRSLAATAAALPLPTTSTSGRMCSPRLAHAEQHRLTLTGAAHDSLRRLFKLPTDPGYGTSQTHDQALAAQARGPSYPASGNLTFPLADVHALAEWLLGQSGEYDDYLNDNVIRLLAFEYHNSSRGGNTYRTVQLKDPSDLPGNGSRGRLQRLPTPVAAGFKAIPLLALTMTMKFPSERCRFTQLSSPPP